MNNPILEALMNQCAVYSQALCRRELQPYEALSYQQACRCLQTWLSVLEIHFKRELDELEFKDDDGESGTTVAAGA